MRATTHQIKTFLLIHGEGSFAAAARHLGVSQVAVSKQMAALERALGGEIFDRRSGARITLNERGHLFLAKAPELLKKAQQLDQEFQPGKASLTTVRIAGDDVVLNTIFYRHAGGFCVDHPDIQVEFIQCDPSLESIASMINTRVDLAYLTLPSHVGPIDGKLLASAEAGLFISPNFAGAHTWHNEATEPLPIILPLKGSKLERSMLMTLEKAGITNYRIATHAQFGDLIRDLAIQGVGACLLAKPRAAEAVAAGKLIQLHQLNIGHTMLRYVFVNPLTDRSQINEVENYFSSLIKAHAHTW